MGEQVVAACAAKSLDPCNVGYLYDIKASTLDVAINKAFDAAIAGRRSRSWPRARTSSPRPAA